MLVTRFPRIDETFILREINELERHGQPVVLVPLLRDHSRVVHEEAKPWIGRALYMPLISPVILLANVRRLATQPRKYLGLLARLILGTMFRPPVFIRTLALFPKSVYLADLLPRLGVRHVHAHFAVHPTTMAYIVHTFSNVTYSFTVHGPDVFVHRLMLGEKIARAKFVRAVSTFVKAYVTGLYPVAAAGKMDVVHIGVNPDVYASEVARTDRAHPRSRILSVASLTEAKGFPFLVDAVARLVGEGIDVECTIVGEGPMRSEIRARIEQHRLGDRIRMTGALPQHEVARLVAECDIFVLPSVIANNGQMDGIPISLMEAMAARRPVIASSLSGIPELVQHGVSGFLVDATHSDRIAGAVRKLIHDPELRAAMGRAGEQRVREAFDVRHTAEAMIALFDRHERVRTSIAQNLRSLNWDRLGTCAIGLRRVRQEPESFIAEVTITNGITQRDVVVKQQRERLGEQKNAAAARARKEFDVLTRLRASMDVPDADAGIVYSVPRVLLFDEENAAIVMDRAAGNPLDTHVRRSRNRAMAWRLLVPLRRAGTWLARMQSATRSGEDGRHILTALVVLALGDLQICSAFDRKIRRHRDKIAEALQELERLLAAGPVPIVGHHGDYRPRNVFAGPRRVDVIDFEAYREGLPLEDAASFLVHLSLSFRYPLFRHQLPRLEQSFLAGYAGGEAIDGKALELFKRTTALRILARGDEAGEGLRARIHRRTLRQLILGM